MKKTKEIGTVTVDSGQLTIIDPCYLDKWQDNEYQENKKDDKLNYNSACHASIKESHQLKNHLDIPVAISFKPGYGDGKYPVLATYDENNTITKIEIRFT